MFLKARVFHYEFVDGIVLRFPPAIELREIALVQSLSSDALFTTNAWNPKAQLLAIMFHKEMDLLPRGGQAEFERVAAAWSHIRKQMVDLRLHGLESREDDSRVRSPACPRKNKKTTIMRQT